MAAEEEKEEEEEEQEIGQRKQLQIGSYSRTIRYYSTYKSLPTVVFPTFVGWSLVGRACSGVGAQLLLVLQRGLPICPINHTSNLREKNKRKKERRVCCMYLLRSSSSNTINFPLQKREILFSG